jgi:RNA polymerase sigma-70 factor (ECF subfamily)
MQTADANISKGQGDTELELAKRISTGDNSAFEELMRRYNRTLYRTARSILKDNDEAEDVLQDAYLLIYRGIGKFRGESSLVTWLTRIVINEAIARTRKTARTAQIIDFGIGGEDKIHSSEEAMDVDKTEQPDHAAMRSQIRKIIEQKIDLLPDAFRTVFMLRALEEMTVEETAACLDIPEATVRTRFFRARGLLRETLAKEIDYGLEDAFSFDGERCDRIVHGTLQRLCGGTT